MMCSRHLVFVMFIAISIGAECKCVFVRITMLK